MKKAVFLSTLLPGFLFVFSTIASSEAAEPMASKEAECTVSLDALTSVLDFKGKGVQSVLAHKTDLEARLLTEGVILKSGIQVLYTVGGCSTYSYTFHFSSVKGLKRSTSKTDAIMKAKALIPAIPVIKGGEKQVKAFSKALDKTLKDKEAKLVESSLPLACTEGSTCRLELPSDGQLKLIYEFKM